MQSAKNLDSVDFFAGEQAVKKSYCEKPSLNSVISWATWCVCVCACVSLAIAMTVAELKLDYGRSFLRTW